MPVRDASNLSVTMTPSVSSVPIGQPLSYAIVVSNPGPTDEPDAVVSIPLPPEVTLVSCSADQGSGPMVTATGISADLGPIPVGGSATVNSDRLTPRRGARTADTDGLGSGLQCRPFPCAVASVGHRDCRTGGRPVDLPGTPAGAAYQGTDLTYTLRVSNGGPSDASNVVAMSLLPPGPISSRRLRARASALPPVRPDLSRPGNDPRQSDRRYHHCHSLSQPSLAGLPLTAQSPEATSIPTRTTIRRRPL